MTAAHPVSTDHRIAVARSHLDEIESEAIHILREVAAEFHNAVLLFSGGKDSTVLLRLAEKAFRPARFPFPLLHIDTGHNFPEVIAFRDATVARLSERLIVRTVQDSIDKGRIRPLSVNQSRNAFQTVTLLDAIAEHGFDACIGGARRDEEKSRAKERIFSFRDAFGQWDPRRQRPELWSLYNTQIMPGEHMRVFPLSNWTELDIWHYVEQERLELPSLYFAHERKVVLRSDIMLPFAEEIELRSDDRVEQRMVRFRTVGDISCTLPVASTAGDARAIIDETLSAGLSERGASRLDDQASEAAMEERKRIGYF